MGIFSEAIEKSSKVKYAEPPQDPFVGIADIQQHLLGSFLDVVSSSEKHPKLIGIISSQAGEGVSTISRMLAYALCYHGEHPTFLIDANFKSPSLHLTENLNQSPGFSDVMGSSDFNLEHILHSRGNLPIRFITAGQSTSSPYLIYAHPQIEVLLEKLRSISDYTIFDLPPVHVCPEVVLLAKKLDGVIFVVKAHHTTNKSIIAAIDRLKRGNVRILGGILNGKKYFIPKWLYDRI